MDAHQESSFAEFCEHHDAFFTDLVSMGWTASEAYSRVVAVYPSIDRELLERALYSGRWVFEGQQAQTHSNVLMASAIWYAIAVSYDFEPNYEYAAVRLDPTIIQDLPRMLESFSVAPETIATILGRIGGALEYMADHPYTQLEEHAYDEFLENLPAEVAHLSRGDFSWPPSRALIEDRLGERSWSRALLKVGVCPPDAEELGISLTAGDVSERTFRNSLGEFLSFCIRYDRKPTVLLYGHWAEDPSRSGRVPHLGAVRAKYGSWHKALRIGRQLINDALVLAGNSSLPARQMPSASSDPTEPLNIEEIKAQGIGVVQPKTLSEAEQQARAWEQLTGVMEQRLEELPWSLSLRLYYISPEVVATGDYTNYVSILRSPAGYFCELSSPEEFDAIDVPMDADYLTSQGWAPPTATGRWAHNFFSVAEAADGIISAMRFGMGADHPDYFQSDDPAGSTAISAAHPSTGSVPMVPITGKGYVVVDDFE
ncbi:TY-Chap domain-containing protein [Rothia nasimurium]|uniref:TY-Chap domain-containing protein n=1 Tax=Rothia nasimurium TaxID=85336 RepID=UPI001F3FB032|nr:hypothetical protein [Rothia nasimurium]